MRRDYHKIFMKHRSLRGFTLIELIMVITIAGLIAAVFSPFISSTLDAWLFTKSERDVVFSARLAMNRMVREIRHVKDTDSISTFTDTEFEFIDINDNSINFQQSNNSLLRNSYELTDKLQNSDGLEFTYLTSDLQKIQSQSRKDDIRIVRITLILESGDSTITIQSLSRFRNVD